MIRTSTAVVGLAMGAFFGIAALRANDVAAARVANQGWSSEQVEHWAYGTQGSRLMPYAWFEALEQPSGAGMFSDLEYLGGFGYLPPPAGINYDRPVGFAVDQQHDGDLKNTRLRWYRGQGPREGWLGFNCAACHTGQVETDSGAVQVLGAPGMGDFQAFVAAVNQALRLTLDQPDRFDRFASKVLQGRDTPGNRNRLRTALAKLVVYQEEVQRTNDVEHQYGFARVDAFGYIFNKALQAANPGDRNRNKPDAPVSYPFLWDIGAHKRIQYNGIAENTPTTLPTGGRVDFGALGRNAAEVIGVFGEVVASRPGWTRLPDYDSSIRVDNLDRIENLLTRLSPPRWEDVFGDPPSPPEKAELLAEGDRLFRRQCASCHRPRDQWDRARTVEVMIPLRTMMLEGNLTDTKMACNAWRYSGPTGLLEGTRKEVGKSERHGERASVAAILTTLVSGALLDQTGRIARSAIGTLFRPGRLPVIEGPLPPPPPLLDDRLLGETPDLECINATVAAAPGDPNSQMMANGYKARPLDGIFATAPYLHNGSVPTLYHLLLPPERRPDSFWVGSRRFDQQNVGYQWQQPDRARQFLFRVRDQAGRPIPGNSNAGHVYGVDRLTERERQALLEYMKTL